MDMSASTGLPWLEYPIIFHSSRASTCKLTPAQCAYRSGYWRNWYEDDHVYGHGTVIFMCTILFGFVLAKFISVARRPSYGSATLMERLLAGGRALSSKQYRLRYLGWYSPPLGLMMVGLTGVVFFACMTLGPQPYYWPNTSTVSYGGSPPIATRSGWMAIALLPFVMVLATKSNPISLLTGVSHEKLQVLHRWTSWTMFILALIHTFPFIIVHVGKGDMMYQWSTSLEYWTGVAALVPQGWLNIMSIGYIRNRYYETFKSLHLVAVVSFVFFLFVHVDFTLTSADYMIAAITLFVATLLISWTRTFLYGTHHCTAIVLPDGYIHLQIPSRTVLWKAGQHVFLRFPTTSLGLQAFTSHPFTIANLWNVGSSRSTLDFYIKPTISESSLSKKLLALAASRQDEGIRVPVIIDGPYGGIDMTQFLGADSVVLLSGGSGVSFILPILELVFSTKCKVRVAIALKSDDSARWVAKTIRKLVERNEAATTFSCDIYVTSNGPIEMGSRWDSLGLGTRNGAVQDVEKGSPTAAESTALKQTDDEKRGAQVTIHRSVRPMMSDIVDDECSLASGQRLCVAACGPEGMQFDVRETIVAQQLGILKNSNGPREIHLHTEGFSW